MVLTRASRFFRLPKHDRRVQHPLIYGDLLIVAPQTTEAGVVAYNKVTGALKWQFSSTRRWCEFSPSSCAQMP
jgi:hypothetical protein